MRVVALLVTLAVASDASAFALRGSVVGTGATPPAGSGDGTHLVFATAGQPVVGASAGPNHTLRHGFWSPGGSRVIAVQEQDPRASPALPAALELGLPVPNPAAGRVEMRLALPAPADVRLTIHDLQGRVVTVLARGTLAAGWHTLRWDGGHGARAAGVYFARLHVGGRPVAGRRIVITD